VSENQAVLKQQKNKDFFYLYLKNVPVVYAAVQAPRDKYTPKGVPKGSLGKEFSVTSFLNDATKEYLEDEVLLNKVIARVGVDKTKQRKIKFPLSSQRTEDDESKDPCVYDPYEDLSGLSLTLDEVSKKGKEQSVKVVDADGNEIDDLIGNGSICNVKCFGYRNQDDQLNITLDLIQVLELVPYEGGSGDGSFEDEELGITIKAKAKAVAVDKPAEVPVADDDEGEDDPF
jgi:hypothetical protein